MVKVDVGVDGYPEIDPQYSGLTPHISSNQLGLRWNEENVFPTLLLGLDCFRTACSNNPLVKTLKFTVAASQVDVLGHSMGGLIAREMWERGGILYVSPNNYHAGLFHRMISLATPHLGSNYALHLLDNGNECTRKSVAEFTANWGSDASIPILAVTIKGTKYNGGAADLVGNGLSIASASTAIQSLQKAPQKDWPILSISYIALAATNSNYACLDSNGAGIGPAARVGETYECGIHQAHVIGSQPTKITTWGPGDFLAVNYSAAGWRRIFDQDNDGFVSVSSALNGLPPGSNGTIVIQGVVHGHGTVDEIGFCGPSAQESPLVSSRVVLLLNAYRDDATFFLSLP